MFILLSIGSLNHLLLNSISSEFVIAYILDLADLVSNQYSIYFDLGCLCPHAYNISELLLQPCLCAELHCPFDGPLD